MFANKIQKELIYKSKRGEQRKESTVCAPRYSPRRILQTALLLHKIGNSSFIIEAILYISIQSKPSDIFSILSVTP